MSFLTFWGSYLVQELSELKWLLLPLYPIFVCVFLAFWVTAIFRRTSVASINIRLLGLVIHVESDAYAKHITASAGKE